MIRNYLRFIFFLLPLSLFAQFKKVATLPLSAPVAFAAIDRPGDLYLTVNRDQLQKIDKDGKVQLNHINNPIPDLFDPRDGARMFAFYRQTRQCAYLNPDFDFVKIFVLDSAFVVDPWLACASGDFDLWVVDAADQSLKKINTRLARIDAEVKLGSSLKSNDILYLREYQGFLFVLSKESGIHIFNSLGKTIRHIAITKVNYFNFLGEELYYLQDGKIRFFDLFSAETREVGLPERCRVALLTDERLYSITEAAVNVFEVR